MKRPGVMQVVDTLFPGGMERVAVNLANLLPRDRYRSYLCTTRREGPLAKLVDQHVGRLSLRRRRTLDMKALRRLIQFIKSEDIRILHAHGTAILLADAALLFARSRAVVWHDHFGTNTVAERPVWLYRLLTRRVGRVLATSRELLAWSRDRLKVPADRVSYVPNFVCEPKTDGAAPEVPGTPGTRIVCVGNVRPAKDQRTLLRAMVIVVKSVPRAHLVLVGDTLEEDYGRLVREEVDRKGLAAHVSFLGQRLDVPAVLQECDVAVLSSVAETCPLALLEYGMASLPVVATDVGQCKEVLDDGRAGLVVPAGRPEPMADALVRLLCSAEQREALAESLSDRVRAHYGQRAVMGTICRIYDSLLEGRANHAGRNASSLREDGNA